MTRRDDLGLSHGATAKVRENAVKQDRVRVTNAIGHHPERPGFLRRTEFIGGTDGQAVEAQARDQRCGFPMAMRQRGTAAVAARGAPTQAGHLCGLPIRLSPTPTICSVSPWTAGKGRRRRIEEAIRLILDCSENRTGV